MISHFMSVSGTLASSADFPSEVLGLAGACTWNCPSFQSDRYNDSTLGNLNIQHNRINNDLIIQFHPYFLLVTCVGVSPERPKIYSIL